MPLDQGPLCSQTHDFTIKAGGEELKSKDNNNRNKKRSSF